jgi:hypothetical protein
MDQPFEYSAEDIAKDQRDRRTISMVRSFMFRSHRYREPHLELAKQSRDIYENWKNLSRSVIQRANLKLPFGFTIIETQTPQVMDLFFKGGNVLSFKGEGADDAMWEDLLTDFHHHQFEEMQFQGKTAVFIKSMLLDGTAIAKVPYRYKEVDTIRRRREVDPISGAQITVKEPSFEVLFDGPDLEIVPIYDFFPDWSAKKPGDIAAMRGCVHRMRKTVQALKQAGVYKNLKELEALSVAKKGCDAWGTPYYFNDDGEKDAFEKFQGVEEAGIKDEGKVEIWEYWGLHDPDGNGEYKEYIITIANGDVIIREEENFYDYKFKPFVACPNYLRENEFYGIPELTAVRSLIKEANQIRNARLDNINLSVNPMWIADRNAGINAKQLFARPNGVVWSNDVNGIKPLPPLDPSIGSREEMAFIQNDIQNATALVNAAPVASTLGKQFGRSATGVNFIQSFSSSRLGLKARILADLYFKRVAWIMLMTNRQFVTDDEWVRISDPNSPNPFEKLPPDAFYRNYDFTVETALDNGGPEGQFQKMQSVSQILQAVEASQPGTIKPDVLLEALLRPLLGRQVKRFVRSDEERMGIQQQNLAAEQAINAQVGQNAPQPNAPMGQGPENIAPTLDVLAGLGLRR